MNKIFQLSCLIFALSLTFFISCTDKKAEQEARRRDSLTKDSIRKDLFMKRYNRMYNDVVRLLAGLEQQKGSTLKKLDNLKVCVDYRKSLDKLFNKMRNNFLSKIEAFRKSEMKEFSKDSLTVFYPFSGPDFIHVANFFPNARTTVMFGLEPVGNIPELKNVNEDNLDVLFEALRMSIDSLAPLGYFMTREMQRDFKREQDLNGTLPVIAVFMAQSGFHILNVKRLTLDKSGKPIEPIVGKKDLDIPGDDYISVGLIEYMLPDEFRVRKLYYLSHDVTDKFLKKTPEFVKFITSFNYDIAFLKAASYLCSWMNTVREVILKNSDAVLQDDSGIPFKYFSKEDWSIKLYGKYIRTLKVFEKSYQKELKHAYDTCKNVKPVNFPYGYGMRINSVNIMIAKKK